MKKFMFSLLALLPTIFFSDQIIAQTDEKTDINLYFKENVAIVDARVRSIDKEHFVKELILHDFKKSEKLPVAFDFADLAFVDNGAGDDKVAGDGVYTSMDRYEHNEKIPYSVDNPERSVLDQALADPTFSHRNELNSYLSSTVGKIKITFDCDIYVCHCNSCSCRTCWMSIIVPGGGYMGVVTHCVKVKNCHFEVTWE